MKYYVFIKLFIYEKKNGGLGGMKKVWLPLKKGWEV
jgi:hypothetical protein